MASRELKHAFTQAPLRLSYHSLLTILSLWVGNEIGNRQLNSTVNTMVSKICEEFDKFVKKFEKSAKNFEKSAADYWICNKTKHYSTFYTV